jgi:hypothetical protein
MVTRRRATLLKEAESLPIVGWSAGGIEPRGEQFTACTRRPQPADQPAAHA